MKPKLLAHKISIIILLLVAAFATVPYGYYTIMRWAILVITLYILFNTKPSSTWIIPIVVAAAFNPIIPLKNSASTWVIYDLVGAALYSILVLKSVLQNNNKSTNEQN